MENKLKLLREKRGLTQSAVADFIGISRQMYNKYEIGEVEPTLKAVKALCTLYAVSYEELLGEIECGSSVKKEKKEDYEYSMNNESGGLYVASPEPAYGVPNVSNAYGTVNVLSQIMELLPKLLYAEKAKLLTTVAQSMTNDVEAGKLAARVRPERLPKREMKVSGYDEFCESLEKTKELMKSINFNTHGVKWTREDMHER